MKHKVMRVVDPTGEVFWLDGHDINEVAQAFGAGCEVEFMVAMPASTVDEVHDESN